MMCQERNGILNKSQYIFCSRDLIFLNRFSLADLAALVPNLCTLVDLTNTDRYYSKAVCSFFSYLPFTHFNGFYLNFCQDLSPSVNYCKIRCQGRELPNEEDYETFRTITDTFLNNPDGEHFYFIHCLSVNL